MLDKIDINTLISYLKLSIIDEKIDSFLHRTGVKRRPFLDERDIENSNFNQWLPIKKIGLELEFKHKDNFEYFEDGNMDSSKLIVTTLIFYSNREDIRTYAYELPYKITFNDTPQIVLKKLKNEKCLLKSYIRDVFDFKEHRLIISYNETRTKVDDVTYSLKSGLKIEPLDIYNIKGNEYIDILNSNYKDKKLRETLDFIDFDKYVNDNKEDDTFYNISKTYGVSFDFFANKTIREVSFLNKGYLDFTKGYEGSLPFELEFSDSQNEFINKIGNKDKIKHFQNSFLEGNIIWVFESFLIEIIYSNLYNNIAKVTIYSTDYWEEEDKEDWIIEPFI